MANGAVALSMPNKFLLLFARCRELSEFRWRVDYCRYIRDTAAPYPSLSTLVNIHTQPYRQFLSTLAPTQIDRCRSTPNVQPNNWPITFWPFTFWPRFIILTDIIEDLLYGEVTSVICGHSTVSMLWGNTAYRVKLSGEDLSRHSNKTESVFLKKMSVLWLSY